MAAYEDGLPSPRIVSYNLASSHYEYMMRMISLGFIEGDLGHMKVPEDLRKVVEAMHMVLAGGEVKIEVTRRGNPDIFNELQVRFDKSIKEANEINEKAGYYFTTV